MSDPVFQKEINNPLVDITGWEDHLALVVGVHQSYRFNFERVEGLIEICRPEDCDDLDNFRDDSDFRNICGESFVTTSGGARLLAEALIQAADAADAISSDNRASDEVGK